MDPLHSLGWNAQHRQEYLENASHLTPGRVVAVDRGSYVVAFDATTIAAQSRVTLAGRLHHLGESAIAVGDWVGLLDTRIDYLFSRRSAFVRKRSGKSSDEQIIAANVDWTLATTSLNDDFSPRRIERFVIAAWDAGTTPVIVITKCDLADNPDIAVAALAPVSAGCEIVRASAVTGEGVDLLKQRVGPGQTAVLVGSSGVGKSSLINAMLGRQLLATATIREGDAKGRHTTTRRELLVIPETGGLIIDTPGIREFGVIGTSSGLGLEQGFADVEDLASSCEFRDCSHQGEPECAVLQAVEDGELSDERLASYSKLQRELAYNERRHDAEKERAEADRWKKIKMEYRRRFK